MTLHLEIIVRCVSAREGFASDGEIVAPCRLSW